MEILIPWKRKVKNAVFQYNDTQIKVRDATSNDPWNPPLGLLIDLADLSRRQYELVSIMQVIWKRLNDRGSNWRHCYKSLFVLEYLIKMGDPQVYQQCKQNLRALQVLTQFQYVDEYGKDVGMNVRQKSVQVLELLMNDAKLMEEREKEVKNREKHEKMQQQLRQQQLQQQQQQQIAKGSKSMPATPKGRDTYVHRLDRNATVYNSSAGYDDPYGGATGSSYPDPNDYGQQPAYNQQYGYGYGYGQQPMYPDPNAAAGMQYNQYATGQYGQQNYAQQATVPVFNPFQASGPISAEQQQAMLSFGSSPEEIKQRMATNPFLCDLSAVPQTAASGENNLPQSVVKDEDFFAALDSAALKALQPEANAAQQDASASATTTADAAAAAAAAACAIASDSAVTAAADAACASVNGMSNTSPIPNVDANQPVHNADVVTVPEQIAATDPVPPADQSREATEAPVNQSPESAPASDERPAAEEPTIEEPQQLQESITVVADTNVAVEQPAPAPAPVTQQEAAPVPVSAPVPVPTSSDAVEQCVGEEKLPIELPAESVTPVPTQQPEETRTDESSTAVVSPDPAPAPAPAPAEPEAEASVKCGTEDEAVSEVAESSKPVEVEQSEEKPAENPTGDDSHVEEPLTTEPAACDQPATSNPSSDTPVIDTLPVDSGSVINANADVDADAGTKNSDNNNESESANANYAETNLNSENSVPEVEAAQEMA